MLHAWGAAMTSSRFALNRLPVYPTFALLAFGEAAAFVGLVLPGETALIGGGALASQGQRQRDCAHGGGDRGGCCRGLGQLRDRPPGGAIPAGGQARTLGGSATVGTGRSSGAPSRRHRGGSWPMGGGSARPGPGDCGCGTDAVPPVPGRQTGGRWAVGKVGHRARLLCWIGLAAGPGSARSVQPSRQGRGCGRGESRVVEAAPPAHSLEPHTRIGWLSTMAPGRAGAVRTPAHVCPRYVRIPGERLTRRRSGTLLMGERGVKRGACAAGRCGMLALNPGSRTREARRR